MGGCSIHYERGSLVLRGMERGHGPLPSFMTWDARIGAYRCLALHHRALVRHLTRAGPAFVDRARAYPELEVHPRDMPAPFPHQEDALGAWSRGKRGVVEMPTGSGKTLLALQAIGEVRRGTLILVPTLELLTQWSQVLERHLGIRAGMIGGGSHEVAPVTVCTYASAYRKGEHFGDRFCLAVFDECHHLAGAGYARIAETLIAPYRLGLSATVADGRDGDPAGGVLAGLIGPMVYQASIAGLRGDILAPYHIETVHTGLTAREQEDYQAARRQYLDFAAGAGIRVDSLPGWQRFVFTASRTPEGRAALEAFQRQKRIAFAPEGKFQALARILSRHREERVLIFTNDNPTAYAVSRRFLLPIITHQTKVAERKAIMGRFRDNRWPFLVTSRVLNEGVDVPAVNVAVVLSGTASVREHVQRLGRILRKAPGKEAVLYEVLSATPAERHVSRRRRMHDAYRP